MNSKVLLCLLVFALTALVSAEDAVDPSAERVLAKKRKGKKTWSWKGKGKSKGKGKGKSKSSWEGSEGKGKSKSSKKGTGKGRGKGKGKKMKDPFPRAVTMWMVFFNSPENCDGPCDESDWYDITTGAGILYGTGGFTDEDGFIRLVASTYRTELDLQLAGTNLIDPAMRGIGFQTQGVPVQFVVQDHGPLTKNDHVNREMISGLNHPQCDKPENPCVNVAIATYGEDKDGAKRLARFGTEEKETMPGKAYLNRQGDALQIILETYIEPTPPENLGLAP